MLGHANTVGLGPLKPCLAAAVAFTAGVPRGPLLPPTALHTHPPCRPSARCLPAPCIRCSVLHPLLVLTPAYNPFRSQNHSGIYTAHLGGLSHQAPGSLPVGAATLSPFPDTDAETKWGDRASRPGLTSSHRSAGRASNRRPTSPRGQPAVHVRPGTPQSIHSQGLASIDTCLIPEPWRAGQAQSSTGTAEEPASGCRKRVGAADLASQGRGCAWPLAPTAQTAGSHGPGGALTYSELLPEDGLLAEGGAVPAPEAELVLALVDAHLRPLPNHDDGIGPALTDGALPRGQARNLVADDVGSQGHDG